MYDSDGGKVVSDSCDPADYSPQSPLSMGFPRQDYWSRLPFPSPGDLSSPGIKPESPALASEPVGLTRKEKKQQRLMNILSMELEFGGLSDPKR